MSWEMKVRQPESTITILELRGKLTLGEGVQPLDKKLQTLVDRGDINLLLECSQVTSIDSSGIGTLVRGLTGAEKRRGKLKLLNLAPSVRAALTLVGLLKAIESYENEPEAIASFQLEKNRA